VEDVGCVGACIPERTNESDEEETIGEEEIEVEEEKEEVEIEGSFI